MALDKFKARLKAKAKTLGAGSLSNARIDAIAAKLHAKHPDITEDADHDTQIDALNELMPLADIAKTDDRVRNLEAKSKAQPQPDADDEPNDDNADDDPPAKPKSKKKNADEPPAWAKSLIDTVATLSKEKVQTSMKTKVSEKLKDKVPEKYYAGRPLPEKEEDLDAFVTQVETDYTDFKQELVNQGLLSSTVAPVGGTGGKIGEKALDASIDSWAKDKVEASKEAK